MDDDHARLWRIRRTVLAMLKERGYVIQDEEHNMPAERFTAWLAQQNGDDERERMTVYATHKDDASETIMVFFNKEPSLGVQHIKSITQKMSGEIKSQRAILVLHGKLTNPAKSAMEASRVMSGVIIEEFTEDELLVNITEHELVPKHEPLSSAAKQELLTRYKLRDTQLPKIQKDDAIARFYGLEKGPVVKITRDSETAGRYVTYRLVV
eukprot:EC798834.1.p1 GENE.EC798834.1~~EC798834.1.p1  ORF type:complete len:210 (+),score=87.95 EC798834.1:39-668(+)